MSRQLFSIPFSLLVGAIGLTYGSAQPAMAQTPAPSPLLEVRDWFALGSGCRSIPDKPRDVHYTIRADPSVPLRYRISVKFDRYGLRANDPTKTTPPSFAQECGLRFGLYAAEGYKLKNASARYGYRVERSPDADVRLRGRLFVGKTQLDMEEEWVKDDAPTLLSRSVDLASSQPTDAFGALKCAEPKIVGLDISVATVRERADAPVLVTLAESRAEVVIDLEPCSAKRTPK